MVMKINLLTWVLPICFVIGLTACSNKIKLKTESCANIYIKPINAYEQSGVNKGHKDGLVEGFKKGIQKGKNDGYTEGFATGQKQGIQIGMDSLMQKFRRLDNDSFKIILVTRLAHKLDGNHRKFDQISNAAYEKAKLDVNRSSFTAGYEKGRDDYFREMSKIQLSKFDYKNKPPRIAPSFTPDFDKLVHLLNDIKDANNVTQRVSFDEAVKMIHEDMLSYLVRRFELTPTEQGLVFSRYSEMHSELTELFYSEYVSACSKTNRNYEKSYYDFKYSHSTDIFLNIVNAHICSLADVMFTYAMANPQWAVTNGFKVMGHVCELISVELLLPLYDYMFKDALINDYNYVRPQIITQTKQILTSSIVETRTHTKTVTETIDVAPNATASIKMEITTIVNVGYFLEDFEVLVDHKNQQFTFCLSSAPRYLNTVLQDYKVLSIDIENTVPPSKTTTTVQNKIKKADFDKIFFANKDKAETLNICEQAFSASVATTLIPTLVKIIEPATTLPYSCYKARLLFSGKGSFQLVSANCGK
jgi:hypothetical protein